jgi:AAA domain/DnaB-like helicase N terminal domain
LRYRLQHHRQPVSELSDRLAASRKKLTERKGATQASGGGDSLAQGAAASSPPSTALTAEKPRARKEKRAPVAQAEDIHRMPPHSVEMELGVLSSIMQDSQFGSKAFTVLAEVAGKITPDYFYVPAHKTIYESYLHLWRAGIAIDLISFTQWMRDHKLLDIVGGAPYVTNLITFVPTAANVVYYTERLTDLMRKREAIAYGTRLVRSAYAAADEDEFIQQVQRVQSGLASLVSTNGKFPAMIDVAVACGDGTPDELPPLVIHYLLHQASKMLLGGNSKGRKTWALMDLALSVATGSDWWGFHTRRGCVCYVNLEIQPAFFRQRMRKIIEVRNLLPERGSLFAWHLRGYAKPMNELVGDLLTFLQQHRFTLIIIDPIYKTLPATHGAENDSAIITQLLNDVEAIAVETDAAVLFSSHFSKGDQSEKEAADRVSGSGAWARDPDSVLTMTPHEDLDCFTVNAMLRNLAPIKEFVVKWDYPLFVRCDDADPDRLRRPKGKGRPVENTAAEVLAAMKDTPWRTAELQKHCAKEEGIAPRVFYRLWAELKKAGSIVETGDGMWRKSTEEDEPF